MSCVSQNFRLFHVSNLSVRNFRIFLLMYTGSLSPLRWRRPPDSGHTPAVTGHRRPCRRRRRSQVLRHCPFRRRAGRTCPPQATRRSRRPRIVAAGTGACRPEAMRGAGGASRSLRQNAIVASIIIDVINGRPALCPPAIPQEIGVNNGAAPRRRSPLATRRAHKNGRAPIDSFMACDK